MLIICNLSPLSLPSSPSPSVKEKQEVSPAPLHSLSIKEVPVLQYGHQIEWSLEGIVRGNIEPDSFIPLLATAKGLSVALLAYPRLLADLKIAG